ncbi:MAG: alanine racemase [Burkholderiales bacterium]|nr:alanine racemase [Burkholderiales bacterium]
MPRPICVRFDTGALAHNLQVVRAAAPGTRVWAVVKANAYGHGLLRAAHALRAADGFALLDLDEAARLREAGFAHPILLLEGFFETADLETVDALHATPVVHHLAQVEMLERAALRRPLDVYLKINTGMNRLGFTGAAVRLAHERLKRLKQVKSVTLMTHFADADGPGGVADQMAAFAAVAGDLPGARSLANSAALLRYRETHGDWVRPGIALYGASPFPERGAADLGLRPAMTLTSEIIAVQTLAAGEGIGYGWRYRAARDMRIGVVACGYADGYPRHAPPDNALGAPVLVDGVPTRSVGRVAMDMLYVDLTALPGARVGSRVVLWGDGLPADDVAAACGTVSYEMFCALAARVPASEATA